MNKSVYSVRWRKVIDAQTNFEAELLEAEVSWGNKAIQAQKPLDALVRELYSALWLYLQEGVEVVRNDSELIYDIGEKDKFTERVNSAIEEIKVF